MTCRSPLLVCLALTSAIQLSPAFAEKGVWRFTGERLVTGKPFLVNAADVSRVTAQGTGSAISSTHSYRGGSSTVGFSWVAHDHLLLTLTPGEKIHFTGTVEHSGDLSASAGLTMQSYGTEPGTGNGPVIMASPTNVAVRATFSGVFEVPEGPLYSNKRMELRFEVYPGGASSALYRTYEWVSGGTVIVPPSAPTGNWSGPWKTDFGAMTLSQNGNRVTGTYEFKGGRIDGTISGNVLSGTWTQTNGSGRFEFTLSADGRSFSGRWGGGQTLTGGTWNGTAGAAPVSAAGVWTGTWATSFGAMNLSQAGNAVTGSYAFKGGRIEGTTSGGVLSGTWTQTNGSGRFEFTLGADGRSFAGRWGYGQTLTAGKWSGTKK